MNSTTAGLSINKIFPNNKNAEDGTRTHTSLRSHVPETCVSTIPPLRPTFSVEKVGKKTLGILDHFSNRKTYVCLYTILT